MSTGAQETGLAISGQEAGPQHPMVEMATTRQAQEVQAAMVVAKKFPRDQFEAHKRIMQACRRPNLAKAACYEYPRGGAKVTGPSIRLAEAMAQAWGNLDFGIIELEQKNGESTVMAYCWDLETNARQTKIFAVPHIRYNKEKGNVRLSDPRDVYEMVANSGARRLRACILGIIPGDVQDDAIEECNKTLAGQNKTPLVDRIKKMVDAFGEIGVTQEDLKKRLQHAVVECTERELISLGSVYNAINDGIHPKNQYFDVKDVGESATDEGVGKPKARGASGPKTTAKGKDSTKPRNSEPSASVKADAEVPAETSESGGEKPAPGNDEEEDHEALLAEAMQLKEQCPRGPWARALVAADLADTEELGMRSAKEIREFIRLVKAGI